MNTSKYDQKHAELTKRLNELNTQMGKATDETIKGMYHGMILPVERAIKKNQASKAKAIANAEDKQASSQLDKLAVMEVNFALREAEYKKQQSKIAALQAARDNILKLSQPAKK